MPLIGVLHDLPGGKGVEVGIMCIVVKPSKGTLYRLDWQGLLSCELLSTPPARNHSFCTEHSHSNHHKYLARLALFSIHLLLVAVFWVVKTIHTKLGLLYCTYIYSDTTQVLKQLLQLLWKSGPGSFSIQLSSLWRGLTGAHSKGLWTHLCRWQFFTNSVNDGYCGQPHN